jgi:hypothetical protein
MKSLRKESEKPVVRAFIITHGPLDFQADEAKADGKSARSADR